MKRSLLVAKKKEKKETAFNVLTMLKYKFWNDLIWTLSWKKFLASFSILAFYSSVRDVKEIRFDAFPRLMPMDILWKPVEPKNTFQNEKIRTYHLHGPLFVLPGVDGAPIRGPPQQAHEAVPEPLNFFKTFTL
jgi:hypothetical protein